MGYYLSLAMGEFLLRWPVNLLTGCWLTLAGAPSQSGACILLNLLSAFGGAILSFLFTVGLALTAFGRRTAVSGSTQLIFIGWSVRASGDLPLWLRALASKLPFEYGLGASGLLCSLNGPSGGESCRTGTVAGGAAGCGLVVVCGGGEESSCGG